MRPVDCGCIRLAAANMRERTTHHVVARKHTARTNLGDCAKPNVPLSTEGDKVAQSPPPPPPNPCLLDREFGHEKNK